MAGILVGTSSNNEAIGELGFKGERGYSAYEIAVQHGFIGTEDEWLASKNEKWQDEGGVDVKFFKGDTEDIEDRAIIHGQLLYNTDSGETFLDYETNRINTGSGNVVAISDTEPTNDATKLWINPDEPLQNIGTEVVNSMSGNETTMAPSVSAVKDYVGTEITDTYSTTEIKTNKLWIDSKPIYRKVIEASGTMTANNWTTLDTLNNVDTLIKGLFGDDSTNCVWNDTMVRVNSNNIEYYSTLAHSYTWLILEYTKTTD